MKRHKRVPIPCAECGGLFKPHRKTSRFCSVACRRAVDARVCKNGHDLTLPGATRSDKGQRSRCVRCEYEATCRYRRRKGVKPRAEYEREESEKWAAHRAEKAAERERRRQEKRTRRGVPLINSTTHVHRPIPTELSRAWGRAGHYSQMRRKYPTRESLISAWRRGEIPNPVHYDA